MSNISRKFSKLNQDYDRRIVKNIDTVKKSKKVKEETLISKLTILGRLKSFFSDFKTNKMKQTLFSILLTLLIVTPFVADKELLILYGLPLVRVVKWLLVAIIFYIFYRSFKFIFTDYFWKRKGLSETLLRSTIIFLGLITFRHLLEYSMLSLNNYKSNSIVKTQTIISNEIKEKGIESKFVSDLHKRVIISNNNHNRLLEINKKKENIKPEPLNISIWGYLLIFFVPVISVSVFRYYQIKRMNKKMIKKEEK